MSGNGEGRLKSTRQFGSLRDTQSLSAFPREHPGMGLLHGGHLHNGLHGVGLPYDGSSGVLACYGESFCGDLQVLVEVHHPVEQALVGNFLAEQALVDESLGGESLVRPLSAR